LHSVDYDSVYEAAIRMQEILVYESPVIVCYEKTYFSAYRTDRLEGYVNDRFRGATGWWTNYRAHLRASEDGPSGGTLRRSLSEPIDTFNILATGSQETHDLLSMLYDSLLRQDANGGLLPWLAESCALATHEDDPSVSQNHTRVTFDLVQNATWSDGEPLTASDVVFTLDFYRDAAGHSYSQELNGMSALYTQTPYRVIIEFDTQSYWHLYTLTDMPILPAHALSDISPDEWESWNPDPAESMVTSGPFNVSEHVPGSYTRLTANEQYFRNPRSDFHSPVVHSASGDLVYEAGTEGHTISWNVTDESPSAYVITMNGTVVESGPWNGSVILFNVDGLDPGTYRFALTVNDTAGNSVSDIVVITVDPAPLAPTTLHPLTIAAIAITSGSSVVIALGSALIVRHRLRRASSDNTPENTDRSSPDDTESPV
ncbi:hypothetical protein EU538_12545, partial [Candidatus Thorarchaeota archaeon]